MNEIQSNSIEQLTLEINFYKEQTAQNIIEIGKRLIQAKKQLEHGEWQSWLEREVDFSYKTANKYMRVSEEFANVSPGRSLSYSKMRALLSLPAEEREEFIEENPVEDMSKRELEKAIKEKKEAERRAKELEQVASQQRQSLDRKDNEIRELRNRPPEVKEIPIETTPMDYEHIKESNAKLEEKIMKLSREVEDKELEIERATKEKELLERKAKLNEQDSEKYKQLKSEIENLSKEKDDIGRQIKSRTELSGLVVRVEHVLKNELAPIRYSRAIDEASSDEIVVRNLRDIVSRVEGWCSDMYEYIPKEKGSKIIDVEEGEYE